LPEKRQVNSLLVSVCFAVGLVAFLVIS